MADNVNFLAKKEGKINELRNKIIEETNKKMLPCPVISEVNIFYQIRKLRKSQKKKTEKTKKFIIDFSQIKQKNKKIIYLIPKRKKTEKKKKY